MRQRREEEWLAQQRSAHAAAAAARGGSGKACYGGSAVGAVGAALRALALDLNAPLPDRQGGATEAAEALVRGAAGSQGAHIMYTEARVCRVCYSVRRKEEEEEEDEEEDVGEGGRAREVVMSPFAPFGLEALSPRRSSF